MSEDIDPNNIPPKNQAISFAHVVANVGTATSEWWAAIGPELDSPAEKAAKNKLVKAARQLLQSDEQPIIACICGSTKFRTSMELLNRRLTLEGKIVLAPGVFKGDGAITDEVKAKLDELHLRKIDMSDEVHIVADGGYIGESTAREIKYAKKTGKPITFHHLT